MWMLEFMSEQIKYKKCQGYQLDETYRTKLVGAPELDDLFDLLGVPAIECDEITIKRRQSGTRWHELWVHKSFTWEPSFIKIHSDYLMVPTMEHDAIYKAIRNEILLPRDIWQKYADDRMKTEILKRIKPEWNFIKRRWVKSRAWWIHKGVRRFGESSTLEPREVMTAP